MTPRDVLQGKFRIFIYLSLFVLLMEIVGGFLTNSLALLSDAGHVLVDLLALLVAYFSIRLSQKKAKGRFSFGYYRGEIFSAVINGMLLILIAVFILYESYSRLMSPQPIKGQEMLVISIIGLAANLYVVIKMHGYEKENLSVKGAYLHVLSDTLSSVGVVIAGTLIIVTGNYIFDPMVGGLIGIFIFINAFGLIKESSYILMEAAPAGIELQNVKKDLQGVKGVKDIHDLHVWSISSDVYALSSHVTINKENIKSLNEIVSAINEMLKTKYNITHTVLQSESETCVDGECHTDHCQLAGK